MYIAQGAPSSSDSESDTDSGASVASDADADLEEIRNDAFPNYFDERDGRLFHSHGGCPYPLPVDAEEQLVSVLFVSPLAPERRQAQPPVSPTRRASLLRPRA